MNTERMLAAISTFNWRWDRFAAGGAPMCRVHALLVLTVLALACVAPRASPADPAPQGTCVSAAAGQDPTPGPTATDADTVAWRGITIIRADPASPRTAEAAWRAVLPEDLASLLLDTADLNPHLRLICDAAVAIGRQDNSEAANALRLRAAFAIASGELREVLNCLEVSKQGLALARVVPTSPHPGVPASCPCTEHLVLVAPATEESASYTLNYIWLHGPSFDRFAVRLAEEKATIGLDEFVRRATERARQEESLWPVGGDNEATISLNAAVRTLGEVGDAASAALQQPIAVDATIASRPLWCQASGVRATDLVTAAAAACGAVFVRTPEGLVLGPPVSWEERLAAALPLPLWAATSSGKAERDVVSRDASRAFWAAATDALERLRQEPVPVRDLSLEAREALVTLVTQTTGKRLRQWLQRFPDRAGVVPMWLYERTRPTHGYQLRTPGSAVHLEGWEHADVWYRLGGPEALMTTAATKEAVAP